MTLHNAMGTLSAGALNKHGFRKVRNFRPISRNFLETVHGRPVVTNVGRTLIGSRRFIGIRSIRVISDDTERP